MTKFEVGDVVKRICGKSGGMVMGDTATVKEILGEEWMELIEYPEEKHLMDRFELVERRELTMEEKITELNKAFNEIALNDNKRALERAKNEVATHKLDINRYQRQLNDLWSNYKNAMNRVKALSSETEKDYTSDMKAILSHKYVTNVVTRTGAKVIEIETDYIDIYDEKGNRFKGNKYLLHFDFGDMTCYIEGLDEDYCRKSYWTDRDPHPHVNGHEGEACWGSAGSMLSESMNNYEIYASFIVVLNFLQQVNTSDAAGEYIRNWDCIDEEGKDLDNPYEKNYEVCCICDDEMDEDDAFYCDDCGDHMCDDHAYWIDNGSFYICQRCYENDYNTCDNCDERGHNDIMMWYGDRVYCEDCYEELIAICYECGEEHRKEDMILTNDEWYCSDCHEDKFIDCAECGEAAKREDTFYCDECGYTYCTDCKEEKQENICEDCYEEEVEESEVL